MTYDVSLSSVALIIGALYILSHLPGMISPQKCIPLLKKFPRHYGIGVILTAAAGIWFAILTSQTDLGELSSYRGILVFVWLVATVLQIIFVPAFLAVRGLALLMLLSVTVMLDSAFMVDKPSRLVIVILAYLWAIAGIFLVASPYLLRNKIDFISRTESRFRFFSGAGVLFGCLLLFLGWFVY